MPSRNPAAAKFVPIKLLSGVCLLKQGMEMSHHIIPNWNKSQRGWSVFTF